MKEKMNDSEQGKRETKRRNENRWKRGSVIQKLKKGLERDKMCGKKGNKLNGARERERERE